MKVKRREVLRSIASMGALNVAAPLFALTPSSSALAKNEKKKQLAEQLAQYAFDLQSNQITQSAIDSAKFRFVDSVGCALSAFHESPVTSCRTIAARAGVGTSTLWGTGVQSQPELAAFSNGVALRYHDLNDVYVGKTTGHPSDNIAACFAVAESVKASGRQFLEATLLAYEINCRLMDAIDLTAKGWDHPIFTLPSVALASSKLLGSNQSKMTQAVNISLASSMAMYQTRVQQMSDWKGIADPDALRNGVFASLLAAQGITGPAPIFEGNAGLFAQVSGAFQLDTANFGSTTQTYKILDCGYKLYPAQVYTLTSIPAAIALAHQSGGADKIASLKIFTTRTGLLKSATGSEKWAPATKETADHSLPYVASRAIFDGDININSYTQEKITEPKILEFMQRVTVQEDPVLSAREPLTTPCRLTAVLKDGRTLTVQVDDVAGSATRPMTRDAVNAKFIQNVSGILSHSEGEALLRSLWEIDSESNLTRLAQQMKPKTN